MVVIRIDTINSFDPVWACTAFPTLATTHKAPNGFLLVCLLLLHREEGTPKMKTDPQSKCSNCGVSYSYVLQGRREYFISWGTYFFCDKCHRLAIMKELQIDSEPPSEPPKWLVIRHPNQITLISPYRSPHWPQLDRSVGAFLFDSLALTTPNMLCHDKFQPSVN